LSIAKSLQIRFCRSIFLDFAGGICYNDTKQEVGEMLFQNIAILDENLNAKEGMYVGIKDKKIDYIGRRCRLSITEKCMTAKKSC